MAMEPKFLSYVQRHDRLWKASLNTMQCGQTTSSRTMRSYPERLYVNSLKSTHTCAWRLECRNPRYVYVSCRLVVSTKLKSSPILYNNWGAFHFTERISLCKYQMCLMLISLTGLLVQYLSQIARHDFGTYAGEVFGKHCTNF